MANLRLRGVASRHVHNSNECAFDAVISFGPNRASDRRSRDALRMDWPRTAEREAQNHDCGTSGRTSQPVVPAAFHVVSKIASSRSTREVDVCKR